MLRRLLLSGCFVGLLVAVIQSQEREQLKNPVFHVPKDQLESSGAEAITQRGPAPVLEDRIKSAIPAAPAVPAEISPQLPAANGPVANLNPQAEPQPQGKEQPVAEMASSIPPVTGTPMPSQPPEVAPVQAPMSESQQILNLAIQDARQNLQYINESVRDYTCLFIKQESVRGEVLPSEYIELKIRNRQVRNGEIIVPFSVYCKFLKPKDVKNREVLYVENLFKTPKLRVKEGSGARRLLPTMVLSVNSPFVMCTNRYPMTEIGLVNLTQRLIDRSVADPEVDACEIIYQDGAKMDGRNCKFLQVKRPVPKVGPAASQGMNVFLAQVLIDEELRVPIRYAAYTWPAVPGSRPEVVEMYTYKDLKLNVGLTDKDFDYENPDYNF